MKIKNIIDALSMIKRSNYVYKIGKGLFNGITNTYSGYWWSSYK